MLPYWMLRQSGLDHQKWLRATAQTLTVRRSLRRMHYTCFDEQMHRRNLVPIIERLFPENNAWSKERLIVEAGNVGRTGQRGGLCSFWVGGRHVLEYPDRFTELENMQRLANRLDGLIRQMLLQADDDVLSAEERERKRYILGEAEQRKAAREAERRRRKDIEKRRRRAVGKAIRLKAKQKQPPPLVEIKPLPMPVPVFHYPTCRPRLIGSCACAGRHRINRRLHRSTTGD